MIETLSHFFKPELQNAASELVARGAVYLKIGSDTQIDASIRGSTPVRVAFRSTSIESEEFTADCTCKVSAKGQLCKHVWATLLVASEKQPDFFAEKTTITKVDSFAEKAVANTKPRSIEAEKRELDTKQRQADYRKQSYQEQKARAKERSQTTTGSRETRVSKTDLFLPEAVQTALKYFEANGFPLELPIDAEALNAAKRVLSRVFHPDKGGTQDEILELLKHSDVLLKHR